MLEDGVKGVILQSDKETYAVAPEIPCGKLSPEELIKIGQVAQKYKANTIKITSASRILVIGLEEHQVDDFWNDLGMTPGALVGICVRSIKTCPGISYCRFGTQDSFELCKKLSELYHGQELPGKMKMGISGCNNQCAETCIKDIGLVGVKSGWKLFVGGNGGGKPRLSQMLTKGLSDEEALQYIEKILQYYKANGKKNQRLGAMIDKMGFEEFQKVVNQIVSVQN
ncbi:MAG: NAD(P)/FAD-dependent oxidoreductase [Fibrobacteria bacterium]|nr:NAD(P)/FAD-dependent oxidoreductase [Fibrobacteria bacterium]